MFLFVLPFYILLSLLSLQFFLVIVEFFIKKRIIIIKIFRSFVFHSLIIILEIIFEPKAVASIF